ENDTLPRGAPQPGAYRVIVTPGYLETLGLKLVKGRFYEEADLAPGRRLFVVDQSFARKFFPKGSAIGGKFSFGGRPAKPEEWPVIIGVVKDVPHNGVEEKSGNPVIYQIMQGGRAGGLTMFLRTNRPTFLRFVRSGWPAHKQSAAARRVPGAFWRIRSGHRNLVDGRRRTGIPPVIESGLGRLPGRLD